jgi:hypothetical protein
MNRRRFLSAIAAVGAGAALTRCGAMVSPASDDGGASLDAPTPDAPTADVRAPRDVPTVDVATDRPPPAVVNGEMVEILVSMSVQLEDVSCSGHNHWFTVGPRRVRRDERVRFLGGSHLVEFSGEELARIAARERVAFATIGDGPGHGHCGLAFVRELGATAPRPTARCRPRNETATCELDR